MRLRKNESHWALIPLNNHDRDEIIVVMNYVSK